MHIDFHIDISLVNNLQNQSHHINKIHKQTADCALDDGSECRKGHFFFVQVPT